MKRIIIAVSFIVLAVFIAIFSYMSLIKQTDKMIASLESLIEIIKTEDNDKTVEEAKKCVELWESTNPKLEIYLDHSMINEIEINFKSIERYAQGDYDIMLYEICYESISHLEHIKESSLPTWGTLL